MPIFQIDTISPSLDPSVFLAYNATVIGRVTIGKKSSVWFNTVIRGDIDAITIGDESNIQDLTMIHADTGKPTIIGNKVTIGHRCVIHGCVIEDNSLIGMGAIVMNGAQIGTGSIVAAGAVIMEDVIIPPYSLVAGIPGRVKRTFEENVVDMIHFASQVYVDRSRDYMNPVKCIQIG
ncbi:MAG: gamma carbonic anhydrase family protein [Proteobacteria bacterium]|nr:gamma carbonic anhydrase family protein [Pseudomonadota bacterium]